MDDIVAVQKPRAAARQLEAIFPLALQRQARW